MHNMSNQLRGHVTFFLILELLFECDAVAKKCALSISDRHIGFFHAVMGRGEAFLGHLVTLQG